MQQYPNQDREFLSQKVLHVEIEESNELGRKYLGYLAGATEIRSIFQH